MNKKLVMFGAGNIGRSFVGQVFSRGGFEVVFVDIDSRVVNALNSRREYRVVIKRNDLADEILWVRGVRAVHANDADGVATELLDASFCATSVGSRALEDVIGVIGLAVVKRLKKGIPSPLDIILAENLRGATSVVARKLEEFDTEELGVRAVVGLVETSIGKMVPIMKEADRLSDPLLVYAEEYNSLIVDAHGFRNPIPEIDGLSPVDNIAAYVDRKLFLHNLGHAAAAYLGHAHDPTMIHLHEAIAHPEIRGKVRRCMAQSAEALHREYPRDLAMDDLLAHTDDLLARFANRALGDTIYRVGRDLSRKLGKDDRLIGAMLLCGKHDLACDAIADAAAAGLRFHGADESGRRLDGDMSVLNSVRTGGIDRALREVCRLSAGIPLEHKVINDVVAAWDRMPSRNCQSESRAFPGNRD